MLAPIRRYDRALVLIYACANAKKDTLFRHVPLRQEVPTIPRDSLAFEPRHNYRRPKQFRLFFRSSCANKAAVCAVHQHPLHHVSACRAYEQMFTVNLEMSVRQNVSITSVIVQV